MNLGTPLPNQAVHPGLLLKDRLKKQGIKQNELATEIGIVPSQLNEILKAKRSLTPELAVLLAEVFTDTTPRHWNRLQADYNVDHAAIEDSVRIKKDSLQKWNVLKQYLPISYFRKQDELSGNLTTDVPHLLEILGFCSMNEFKEHIKTTESLCIHFKKSGKLSEYVPYVNTWVRYVKHLSTQQQASKIDFDVQEDVIKSVKKVFLGNDVERKLHSTLLKHGIKLIIKEKPDHVPLDGAAFMHKGSPVVGLTKRHKRYDNFIFTVYHELAHVFLHLKHNPDNSYVDSLDDTKGRTPDFEKEADNFAGNCIVPSSQWADFTNSHTSFSDTLITKFAASVGVPAPSIWGRLCHEDIIGYSSPSRIRQHNQIP